MASYSVAELAKLETFPPELTISGHLVWNSPATIDFNSPGAQGFGVKRAGLTIPGSLMLLISPAACGRNTNALSGPGQYGERFAYLELTSTDIVTGSHLSKIPEAARLFLASRKERPSCLLLCTTCVDALLGTDMERICRKVEDIIDVPVRPCYMYALTRESLHPPMVHVRETIYSLLQPRKKDPRAVNLLGFFSPIDEHSELFHLLHAIGIRTIRQISTYKTYEDFQRMAEANFNLVLNPEALPAAEALATRLKIPYITLDRFYTPGRIHKQYQALAKTLQKGILDAPHYEATKDMIQQLRGRLTNSGAAGVFPQKFLNPKDLLFLGECPRCPASTQKLRDHAITIALGSRLNAQPLELALLLLSCGCRVTEIFTTLAPSDRYYLRLLAETSPDTRIYGNLSPSLASFDPSHPPTLTLGADAAVYYPDTPNIPWNDEIQPFGYAAVKRLLNEISTLLERNQKP